MGYIPPGSRLTIEAFTKEVILREHKGTREGYSVCYVDGTPFGDARLPRKYSSMILQQASKQRGPSALETVRCKAVRIMQSPFFEVGKERRSTSFLLIARQTDLYPSRETSLDDSTNLQTTKTDIPHESANPTTDEHTIEFWVRIGSGTTIDLPYKTGDFLGVFSGSGKEEIVLA